MLGFKYLTQHIKCVLTSKSTFSSSHPSLLFVITSTWSEFNVDHVLRARCRGGYVLRKASRQVKRMPWTSQGWTPSQSERHSRESNRQPWAGWSFLCVSLTQASSHPESWFSHLCHRSGSCSYQLRWVGKKSSSSRLEIALVSFPNWDHLPAEEERRKRWFRDKTNNPFSA